MSDLRTPIFTSLAKSQAGYDPAVGDALVVGTRQAFVTAVSRDGVTLHYDDGLTETQPVEAIRGRAIARLEVRPPGSPAPTYLGIAWDIARAKDVSMEMRASQLAKTAAWAPTPEDAATVRGWSVALMAGKVPVRM